MFVDVARPWWLPSSIDWRTLSFTPSLPDGPRDARRIGSKWDQNMMRAIHRLRHVGGLFVALVFALSLPLVAHAVTNTWSAAGSLITARAQHTATLLPSGQVLVAGGQDSNTGTLASAELYDPATNTWSVAGSLITAREIHTATLLLSGQV